MPKIQLIEGNELNREQTIEAGCDDFNTKPVEMPRLLGTIETLLR